MTRTTRPLAALAATASLALVLAGCAGGTDPDTASLPAAEELGDEDSAADCEASEPDCQDTIDPAAGSCLAGDADCTDESYGGQDVTRPVLLTDSPSGAPAIEPGTSSGATGTLISNGYLVDDTTLELTFDGGSCDVLEDVLITEDDAEVRLLVLAGQSADADMCTAQVTQWTTTVTLSAPLGDRELLDLAG